jgi:hypothetical protein
MRAKGIRFEHAEVRVAEEDNPVAAVEKAVEHFHLIDDEVSLITGRPGSVPWVEVTWTAQEKQIVERAVERHSESFHNLDVAAKYTTAIPAHGEDLAQRVMPYVRLGQLLCAAAIVHHEGGRVTECLQDVRRLDTLSKVVDHGGNFLCGAVAMSIRSMRDQTIEHLEPKLKLRAEDSTNEGAQELLRALLDPEIADSGARNFESHIGYIRQYMVQRVDLEAWWARPLRDDDIVRVQTAMIEQVEGFHARDWATSQAFFRSRPVRTMADANLDSLAFWCSGSYGPDANWCSNNRTADFWEQANAMATAILLASRLYAAKHGRLPNSVGELIPDYLPRVPQDPFSPTRAAMRIRVDADGWTVWSVGENQTDEGGIVRLDSSGKKLERWGTTSISQSDLVYGSAWRNAKAPAGTAASERGRP